MRKSAKMLGENFGLNAETMNAVLYKLGYLEGEPGAYNATAKADQYVAEDVHGGSLNGYPRYNPAYQTRSYDESFEGVLASEVTDEVIAEAKEMVRERKQGIKEEKARKLQEYKLKYESHENILESIDVEPIVSTDIEVISDVTSDLIENSDNAINSIPESDNKSIRNAIVITGVTIATGYALYKGISYIRRKRKNRKAKSEAEKVACEE